MRSLIRLFGWLLVMTLLGDRAAAQPTVELRVVTAPVDTGGQVYYAQDLGLFRKAGLDVHVSSMTNGSAIVAGLVAGSFDIAQTNVVSLALAHERGIPFVIVAPGGLYTSTSPTTVLAVARNAPIHAAADLNGKTIAVPGVRSITEVAADLWIDKNGGDSRTVKYVEMPFASMPAALQAGRIDAAVLVDPILADALARGVARTIGPVYDATGSAFLLAVYISTADFAKTHPDVVRRFAAVMAEAAHWANTHHDDSATILEKWTHLHLPPGTPRIEYAERLTPELVQPLIDDAAKYNVLKADFPASDLFAVTPSR